MRRSFWPGLSLAVVALTAVTMLIAPGSASAATSTWIWGPGCPSGADPNFPYDPEYGPTGGTWWTTGGDYTGAGIKGPGNCSGTSLYAWNGTAENFQWTISPAYLQAGRACHVNAYIPTQNAGVYAARYDFWWQDLTGGWHWLAWPGHNVDQEHSSGWIQIMYNFTMPSNAATFKITLRDETSADSAWRYMGAGDMALICG